jgi:Spy/CpxP family protein refolding chaperone
MRNFSRFAAVLPLVLLIACPLWAQEKEKGKRPKGAKKKAGEPAIVARVFALPKEIELTDEQQAEVAELKAKHADELVELEKKREGVLSAEQREARAAALKSAKEQGKKGPEVKQAIEEAMKLTDEQKAQMKELAADLSSLEKEIRTQLLAILTPEQQAKLPKGFQKGKAKGKGGEKPKKKKPEEI